MPRNAEVPPQRADEEEYRPFVLGVKIDDMVKYGYPLTMNFPRRCRELEDEMRRTMISMEKLSTELDRKYYKKTTTQTLDIELAWLRKQVVMASEKELYGKNQPPLTMHQREVWAKMNDEIGRLLGGYLKSLKQ